MIDHWFATHQASYAAHRAGDGGIMASASSSSLLGKSMILEMDCCKEASLRGVFSENTVSTASTTELPDLDTLQMEIADPLSSKTLLKIILKCKDDAPYLQTWIEYHATIVGYSNLVIVDCGSSDQLYLSILHSYVGKVLIFRYREYYDKLHWYNTNSAFYDMLVDESSYLTVLDADEFLFGLQDEVASSSHVLSVIRQYGFKAFAGTWFNNMSCLAGEYRNFGLSDSLEYASDRNWVDWGSVAGKIIVQSEHVKELGYIGHNLATRDVVTGMAPDFFGKIGILHVNRLNSKIVAERAMRHLVSKKVIAEDIRGDMNALERLRACLDDPQVAPIEKLYIRKYLSIEPPPPPTVSSFRVSLSEMLKGVRIDPSLLVGFTKFDFEALIRKRDADLSEII